MAERKLPKRLYIDVSVIAIDKGYGIALDGNVLKTPAATVLFTEYLQLIEAVAMEWEGQKIEIDIQSLPLFRLLVASIDDVGPKREEVNRKTLQFGATDLLCYFAQEELNVSFQVTDGISPITRSQETLSDIGGVLATFTDLEMTSVY
ncbi:MAG: ATP12 family protein, partial [Rhodospirillales bacterium]